MSGRHLKFTAQAPAVNGATGAPLPTPAGRATLIHDRNDAITLAMSAFACVVVAGIDLALWLSL